MTARGVGQAADVVATGGEPKVFIGEGGLKLIRPGAILPLSVCPDCEFYERKATATCPRCGSTADAVVVCVQVLHESPEEFVEAIQKIVDPSPQPTNGDDRTDGVVP